MSYTSSRKTAYNMIKKKGASVTIKRKATGSHIHSLGIDAYATAKLVAGINDSVITFQIKNISTAFYATGTIWVDSEKITYTTNVVDVLGGMTRGVGISAPASHLIDADVYLEAQDTSYSTYGVLLNYTREEIDGDIIQRGDKQILIPALNLDIVPGIRDIITIGSTDWLIMDPNTLQPDNTDVMYRLQLRGS